MSENLEKKETVEQTAIVTKEDKKAKKEKKKLEKGAKNNDSKIIILIVAAVIVVALCIFGYFLYNKSFKAIAKFDGGSVSASDFEIYYRTFAPMLQYYGYSEDLIPEIIAEKAASDKIITTRAKKAGVKISDEDKAYVDEIFSDEEQLQTFTDAGIDAARMKQFYYNDYIMEDYMEYLKQELTDEEVKSYITTTHGEDADMREYVTAHILFKTIDETTYESYDDAKKAEIRATAESVLARALQGEDFTSLVLEFSEDTATVEQGEGEYRVYMDDNTVEEYVNAAVTLAPGEIYATLVETQYGYHIIKLNEYNEQGRVNSDIERENIVTERLNNITDEVNLELQQDILKEVVESITGGVEAEDDATDDTTEEEHDHTHEETTDTTTTDETGTIVE